MTPASFREVSRPVPTSTSVQEGLLIAEAWENLPGERKMVASVLRWLLQVGWLGSASRVAFEVPWRGRRIDLVTANGKGHLSAFEFKLGGTRRAFEQAMYNSISTNRSLIVSGGKPTPAYRAMAEAHGLGVIVVNGHVELLQRPVLRRPEPEVLRSLRERALARAA
jgi:hypothetical protein